MLRSLALLVLVAATSALAADPVIDTKQLDKSVIASLREIHDRGADLYNQSKDYPAAYRLYEGALLALKPLLGHRPGVQKTIGDGLTAAGNDTDPARKAFLLHETIEKVRADLKSAAPMPKIVPKSVDPKPKDPVPMPKPKDPDPKPKEPAPMPMPKEPAPKVNADASTVSGKITVQGKLLAEGTVTFVTLDQKAPKVASGAVKDGAFSVKDLLPGKYAVAVTGKPPASVPAKFATTDTSGVVFTAKAGTNELNIDLK